MLNHFLDQDNVPWCLFFVFECKGIIFLRFMEIFRIFLRGYTSAYAKLLIKFEAVLKVKTASFNKGAA